MPDLPEEAVQAAARAMVTIYQGFQADGATSVDEEAARAALEAVKSAGLVVVSAELLDALTDPDECWFDHHGGCQAHGYLSLQPGERCPQAEARELLAALPERAEDV